MGNYFVEGMPLKRPSHVAVVELLYEILSITIPTNRRMHTGGSWINEIQEWRGLNRCTAAELELDSTCPSLHF